MLRKKFCLLPFLVLKKQKVLWDMNKYTLLLMLVNFQVELTISINFFLLKKKKKPYNAKKQTLYVLHFSL